MPIGICRVTDAKTGKLKRFETNSGKVLAIVRGNKLYLTDLGRKMAYKVAGKKLLNGKGIPL